MSTSLRERADALRVAAEDAAGKLTAVEAALAEAEQAAQTALVGGDMAAADKAHAAAGQARVQLEPARAVVESIAKARREVAAELARTEQADRRDVLTDTIAAERERLHTLVDEAVTGLRTAQANLKAAQAGEDGYRGLQRELHDVQVSLGEVQRTIHPDKDVPVGNVLNGPHAPLLYQILTADLTRGL